MAVYTKKGAMYPTTGMSLGTKASKSIFAGLGGRCEGGSDVDHGDTVVRYDQLARPLGVHPAGVRRAVRDVLRGQRRPPIRSAPTTSTSSRARSFPTTRGSASGRTATTSAPAPATTSCRSASASPIARRCSMGQAATEQCIGKSGVNFFNPVRRRRHDGAARGRAEHRDGAGRDAAEPRVRGRRRLRLQVPRRLGQPVGVDADRPDEDHRRALPLPVRRPAHELRAADGIHARAWTPRATS